jgi:ProP effector
MTITKQDINAVLTRLTEAFPQAFVLEQYQPHRPLKVGIFSEIAARCPDLARSDLATVLNIYTRRMTYLQSLVAGAARVDLDGVPCGEVTAADQEYAAARLTEIQVARAASAPRQPLGCGPRNRQQLWLRRRLRWCRH